MKLKIKEPGSAITHFIGWLMDQVSQGTGQHPYNRNECFYAEHDPVICGEYYLPHR